MNMSSLDWYGFTGSQLVTMILWATVVSKIVNSTSNCLCAVDAPGENTNPVHRVNTPTKKKQRSPGSSSGCVPNKCECQTLLVEIDPSQVEKDLFQRARFDIHIYLERNLN